MFHYDALQVVATEKLQISYLVNECTLVWIGHSCVTVPSYPCWHEHKLDSHVPELSISQTMANCAVGPYRSRIWVPVVESCVDDTGEYTLIN